MKCDLHCFGESSVADAFLNEGLQMAGLGKWLECLQISAVSGDRKLRNDNFNTFE